MAQPSGKINVKLKFTLAFALASLNLCKGEFRCHPYINLMFYPLPVRGGIYAVLRQASHASQRIQQSDQ